MSQQPASGAAASGGAASGRGRLPGRDADVPRPAPVTEALFTFEQVSVTWAGRPVFDRLDLRIPRGEITAVIGPSGGGKTTLLRVMNRMLDLEEDVEVVGRVTYHGQDLYAREVDPMIVRQHMGMVFQQPNPFQRSVYDNVAFGPRLRGQRRGLDRVVEQALRRAALWDEVSSDLRRPAHALSGGQQQRLCIARALATEPDVLLLDEPTSSLDPIATFRIEELLRSLRGEVTLVLVTHDLQQAARVSDRTLLLAPDLADGPGAAGQVIEYDLTERLFTNARDPRTEAFLTGRSG